jgi:hypothetical protein
MLRSDSREAPHQANPYHARKLSRRFSTLPHISPPMASDRSDSASPIRNSSASPTRSARARGGRLSDRIGRRLSGEAKLSSEWVGAAGSDVGRHALETAPEDGVVRSNSDARLSSAGTNPRNNSREGRRVGPSPEFRGELVVHKPQVLGQIVVEPDSNRARDEHAEAAANGQGRDGAAGSLEQVPVVKKHGIACGSGVCTVQ